MSPKKFLIFLLSQFLFHSSKFLWRENSTAYFAYSPRFCSSSRFHLNFLCYFDESLMFHSICLISLFFNIDFRFSNGDQKEISLYNLVKSFQWCPSSHLFFPLSAVSYINILQVFNFLLGNFFFVFLN